MRIGIDGGPVLLQPDRRGSCDLRRCRRCALAVEIDNIGATEARPRHVRGRRGNGGPHLAVGAVIAGHQANAEIGIGLAVRHHAARRDHPVEPRGVDDVVGRQALCRSRHSPAAVTMKTPCSYSAFTASAHACDARPPMLMVMMSTRLTPLTFSACT